MILLNEEKAKIFLAQNNIDNFRLQKIAGDASFRSYYRIFSGAKTFILMFAPPSHEPIEAFIKIDKFLIENNFSAPKIFAIDEKEGFILLEDFGDKSYSKVLALPLQPDKSSVHSELEIYQNACSVLIELHKINAPQEIELYNNALLLREVMLFVDWYLPFIKNKRFTLEEVACFKRLWLDVFDLLNREKQVLVLRDYHADNLMLLENRDNYKSVGLLDFQDAVAGFAAYDLVSLLEDARRNVDEKTRIEIFSYYLREAAIDQESFARDYAILSLQRNIKILGIFVRLANRDSKPHYLNFLPRVIKYVIMRLESMEASPDSAFKNLAIFLKNFI